MIRRAGYGSWLVELADGAAARTLWRHLAALRDRGTLPGVVELVPGARTVLLDGGTDPGRDDRLDRARLSALLAGWTPGEDPGDPTTPVVTVPVRYDGADLAEVAELAGLTRDEVVACHTSAELTVAFCGFAPGFAYLAGLPERLRVPRRPEPRTSVPAGAVALAGGYTGVYPRSSPGGWQLIGRTSVQLWDAGRPEPALLTPGTRVRFEVDGS